MGNTMTLTKELCNELFEYKDGKLLWKVKPAARTSVGDQAGGNSPIGYRVIAYKGLRFYTHRAVFLMHYGYLPDEIDHIDGDKTNNKIENLRKATRSQNLANKSMQSNNTSGYRGVWWSKEKNRWIAEVWSNKKKNIIGSFLDKEKANEAACLARKNIHGEFAKI